MAKLVIALGAGEPQYSSCKSIAAAMRELGHKVITVGPPYFDRADADILLPDRPHVEWYTVEEVLRNVPWQPDMVLNVEPHCFLMGPKPDGLPVVFCATDAHRAGVLYHRALLEGAYDYFINLQPYFSPLFQHLRHVKMLSMPVAFDVRRFPMQERAPSPEVDIVFIGHAGIANLNFDQADEIGFYTEKLPPNLPTDMTRYASYGIPSLDYCQRAELLIRLMGQFRVRIYREVWGSSYQAALQKGAIGFHRSLLHDIAIRTFEVCAAGRLLLADYVSQLDTIFNNGFHCQLYDSYFFPRYPNFDLEAALVTRHVRRYLDNDTLREAVAERGYDLVWAKHTWAKRAQHILDFVLNG